MIKICFDMDGTIVGLYSVPDWLPKLRSNNPSPYREAKPLYNMAELNEICALLQKAGYEIEIITAMSKGADRDFKKEIRKAKLDWLEEYGFNYDRFHGIDYTANKSEAIRYCMRPGDSAILVDDEKRHLDHWKWGPVINAQETNLLIALLSLLPSDLR